MSSFCVALNWASDSSAVPNTNNSALIPQNAPRTTRKIDEPHSRPATNVQSNFIFDANRMNLPTLDNHLS
jgi:hypothetical protein